MRPPLLISSLKNPKLKATIKLKDAAERAVRGVFAVEGAREIERALTMGFEAVEIYVCPERLSSQSRELLQRPSLRAAPESYELTVTVFAKLAMREGKDGLIVVFTVRAVGLEDLHLSDPPLLLAIEGVEKPGNLGALLRSADGAGVDGVIIVDGRLDVFNPNVIRASLGTVFKVPVITMNRDELTSFAASKSLKIVAAALSERGKTPFSLDLAGGVVLLLGAEDKGLTEHWLDVADEIATLPMRGLADSLNVAAAGAVLMYEAVRQRALR